MPVSLWPPARPSREAALDMLDARPGQRRLILGTDKAHDTAAFVAALCKRNVTPHVVQNTTNRRSAADRRTARMAATPSARRYAGDRAVQADGGNGIPSSRPAPARGQGRCRQKRRIANQAYSAFSAAVRESSHGRSPSYQAIRSNPGSVTTPPG